MLKEKKTTKMLCLLIYLFSISLHLYFFISLCPISIDTVNGIRILRIFCYLNISEKIQSLNKFLAQQTCKLRPRVLGWEFKVKSSGFNAQSLRLGFKKYTFPTHSPIKSDFNVACPSGKRRKSLSSSTAIKIFSLV